MLSSLRSRWRQIGATGPSLSCHRWLLERAESSRRVPEAKIPADRVYGTSVDVAGRRLLMRVGVQGPLVGRSGGRLRLAAFCPGRIGVPRVVDAVICTGGRSLALGSLPSPLYRLADDLSLGRNHARDRERSDRTGYDSSCRARVLHQKVAHGASLPDHLLRYLVAQAACSGFYQTWIHAAGVLCHGTAVLDPA